VHELWVGLHQLSRYGVASLRPGADAAGQVAGLAKAFLAQMMMAMVMEYPSIVFGEGPLAHL
jgi:hypothetical protein